MSKPQVKGQEAILHLLLIPNRVLGLPQSIEVDKRPDKKFRQSFIGAPAAVGGGAKTGNSFPC